MIEYQTINCNVPYNYNIWTYRDYSGTNIHMDYEFIYVLKGQLDVTIESYTETLSQGESALILPNQVHTLKTRENTYIWIIVFAKDYVPEFHKKLNGRICLNNKCCFEEFDKEIVLKKLIIAKPNRLELCAILSLICADFMKTRQDSDFVKSIYTGTEKLLHLMLAYVNDHFRENITLHSMAQSLGYDEHYVSRCFNNYFGKNFKQFLNEYRINYARELLANMDRMEINMAEIAYLSGFQSVRNFNRAYKSIVGKAPREDSLVEERIDGRAIEEYNP